MRPKKVVFIPHIRSNWRTYYPLCVSDQTHQVSWIKYPHWPREPPRSHCFSLISGIEGAKGDTLQIVWWVCATDSSKPLPCIPKGVGWGVGTLRNVWWVCATISATDSSKPSPCTTKGVGWGGVGCGVLSGMIGGYETLTPLNLHLVPPRGRVGSGVLSGMFGGYLTLTPLNPHLVPPRGWGGVWGTPRNVWWVCAMTVSQGPWSRGGKGGLCLPNNLKIIKN